MMRKLAATRGFFYVHSFSRLLTPYLMAASQTAWTTMLWRKRAETYLMSHHGLNKNLIKRYFCLG